MPWAADPPAAESGGRPGRAGKPRVRPGVPRTGPPAPARAAVRPPPRATRASADVRPAAPRRDGPRIAAGPPGRTLSAPRAGRPQATAAVRRPVRPKKFPTPDGCANLRPLRVAPATPRAGTPAPRVLRRSTNRA